MREIPVGKNHVALVDDDDYERVTAHRWFYAGGYAVNPKVGPMHCFIMKPPKGYIVHHQKRNRLDNRKAELEILTPKEHSQRHAGDEWHKRSKRYSGNGARAASRIPEDVMAEMRRLAKQHDRSLNGEMVAAFRAWIRTHAEGQQNGRGNRKQAAGDERP
jgi:hypothetical protein